MGHEQRGSRAFIGDVLNPLAESIDLCIQVLVQRLELTATMGGVRRERQRREQRLALADDVANAAEYLASELASFVSGQHLLVTGGAPA
jgi:NAD(P)-dependent dehydrogenase (short-subunit alcohol dehydrogenase family)